MDESEWLLGGAQGAPRTREGGRNVVMEVYGVQALVVGGEAPTWGVRFIGDHNYNNLIQSFLVLLFLWINIMLHR